MEPYIMCHAYGEKISMNFSYCRKCGAELPLVRKTPQSARETDLAPSMSEKTAIDSIQLSASESIEISYIEEEREIIIELEQLRDSPFAGRIIALLLQLDELPSLSPRTHTVLSYFKTHSNDDVKIESSRILLERKRRKSLNKTLFTKYCVLLKGGSRLKKFLKLLVLVINVFTCYMISVDLFFGLQKDLGVCKLL